MIYRLRHATIYDYAKPVVLGMHYMHLLPRARPGQLVREAHLEITPGPGTRRNELDHFGNHTTTVDMAAPHRQFMVTLSATVDVALPRPPQKDLTAPWEDIAAQAVAEPDAAEFCLPSHLAAPTPRSPLTARPAFPPAARCWPGSWT